LKPKAPLSSSRRELMRPSPNAANRMKERISRQSQLNRIKLKRLTLSSETRPLEQNRSYRKTFFMNQIVIRCICCILIWYSGLGFAGAVDTPPSSTLQVPSISIPDTDFNFGEVSEIYPLSHDFIVKNGGKAALHINDVSPS